MAASIDKLIHDLANKMSGMAGSASIALSSSENKPALSPLVSEIERAMKTMQAMQDVVKAARTNPKDESAA